MDKISLKINSVDKTPITQKNKGAETKTSYKRSTNTLQNQLNSLAFCGKVQLTGYALKRKEEEAFKEFLKINIYSKTEDIKKLLENPYLKDVHRASLEKILLSRKRKGSVDNPYTASLSNENITKSTIRIYNKKDKSYDYYEILDADINSVSKDGEIENGILKNHADSHFAEILKKLQYDKNGVIDDLTDNYEKSKAQYWGEGASTLEFLSDISSEKLDFDTNKTIEKLFPDRESYIQAVMEKIDNIIEEEKTFLSNLPALQDEHIFYRGISNCKNGDMLNKNIDSWDKEDVVMPQFNPMFTSTDINTASVYLSQNKNDTARLFRITTPKGAKLPYTKEKNSESIFPAKSKFKYKGKERFNNLEIINLEYLP